VVIVHGGGLYGDKCATEKRLIKNLKGLPPLVKKYLVIENDEKCYSAGDVLKISAEAGIRAVIDYFHIQCYRKLHPSKLNNTNDVDETGKENGKKNGENGENREQKKSRRKHKHKRINKRNNRP
jgi:UV DNA damage endonuclease